MKTRKVLVNFFVTSRVETNIEVPADLTDEQVKLTLHLWLFRMRATYNPTEWQLTATKQMIDAADKIGGNIDWQDYKSFCFGDTEGN